MKINACCGILLTAAWGIITVSSEDISRLENAINSEYEKTNGNISVVSTVRTNITDEYLKESDETPQRIMQKRSGQAKNVTTERAEKGREKSQPEEKKTLNFRKITEAENRIVKYTSKLSVQPSEDDTDASEEDVKEEVDAAIENGRVQQQQEDEEEDSQQKASESLQEITAEDERLADEEEERRKIENQERRKTEKEESKDNGIEATGIEDNAETEQEITAEDEKEADEKDLENETEKQVFITETTIISNRSEELNGPADEKVEEKGSGTTKAEDTIETYPGNRRGDVFPVNYVISSGAKVRNRPYHNSKNDLAKDQSRYYWNDRNAKVVDATSEPQKEEEDTVTDPPTRASIESQEAEEDEVHPFDDPEPVSYSTVVYNPDGKSSAEMSGSFYTDIPLTIRIPVVAAAAQERSHENEEEAEEVENQSEPQERIENSVEDLDSATYTTATPGHLRSIQTPLKEIKYTDHSVRYTHPPPINFEALTNWYNPNLEYNQFKQPAFELREPIAYTQETVTKEEVTESSVFPTNVKDPFIFKPFDHGDVTERFITTNRPDPESNREPVEHRRPATYANKVGKPQREEERPVHDNKVKASGESPLKSNTASNYNNQESYKRRPSSNTIRGGEHINKDSREKYRPHTNQINHSVNSGARKLTPTVRDYRYRNETKEQPGEKSTSTQEDPRYRPEDENNIHSRRPQKFTDGNPEESTNEEEKEEGEEPQQQQQQEEEIQDVDEIHDSERLEIPISPYFEQNEYLPNSKFESLNVHDEIYNEVLANIQSLFTDPPEKPKTNEDEPFIANPLLSEDYQSFLSPHFQKNSFEKLREEIEKEDETEAEEDNEEQQEENEEENEEITESEDEEDADGDGDSNAPSVHVNSDTSHDTHHKQRQVKTIGNKYLVQLHPVRNPVGHIYKIKKGSRPILYVKPIHRAPLNGKYHPKYHRIIVTDGHASPGNHKIVKVYVPKAILKKRTLALPTNHRRLLHK